MKNALKITFALFFIVLISYPNNGQNICFAQEDYQEGGLVTLYKGEIRVIAVDSPTRVAITNPAIADVTSVTNDEMVIMGNNEGATSLIWWDNLGQHAVQVQIFTEDMSLIKQRIDNLLNELKLPEVYTRSIDSEGKVLILGKVKAAETLGRIATVLGPFQHKITNLVKVEEEEASIEIDMQILEISKDATKELGISLPASLTLSEPGMTANSSAVFNIVNYTRSALSSTINLMTTQGKARILSRPRLVCQSGKEANFLVGGEKPIMTTTVSEGGSGTDVDYKEYGIKLAIRPKVMPKNRIQVALDVEVSEVGTAEFLGSEASPTAKAYPLIKRSTSTQLILDSSQTLAISGLIKQKSEETLKKFPWLGDIPILGMFFRSRKTLTGGGSGEKGDIELVIMLTPTILAESKISPTEVFEPELPPEDVNQEASEEIIPISSRGSDKAVTLENIYPEIYKPAIASYTRRVIKRIQDNFVYPLEAAQEKIEGLVNLSLHVSSSGQLLDVKINQSSGSSILDENAVKIIQRVSPFPSFPPDIEEKELWINIPINYNLQ
ncbi:MAG: TonB family protein [Candidatus Omnitrophota bacterium]